MGTQTEKQSPFQEVIEYTGNHIDDLFKLEVVGVAYNYYGDRGVVLRLRLNMVVNYNPIVYPGEKLCHFRDDYPDEEKRGKWLIIGKEHPDGNKYSTL